MRDAGARFKAEIPTPLRCLGFFCVRAELLPPCIAVVHFFPFGVSIFGSLCGGAPFSLDFLTAFLPLFFFLVCPLAVATDCLLP